MLHRVGKTSGLQLGSTAKYTKGQSVQGQLLGQHIRQLVPQMLHTGRYIHDIGTKVSLAESNGKIEKPYNLCVHYLSLQRSWDWAVLKATQIHREVGVGLMYAH